VERWEGHAGTLITDPKSIVTGTRTGGQVIGNGTNEGRRSMTDALPAVHKTYLCRIVWKQVRGIKW
jgi:hypothetical protein